MKRWHCDIAHCFVHGIETSYIQTMTPLVLYYSKCFNLGLLCCKQVINYITVLRDKDGFISFSLVFCVQTGSQCVFLPYVTSIPVHG